jgi:tetrahydromethanopterin S-methyltransferase subunit E
VKQITKRLKDFILAFDLAHPVTGICFDAIVFFYTDTLVLQIESQIHIITILAKKVDVLYILNPEITKKGFLDMFESAYYDRY